MQRCLIRYRLYSRVGFPGGDVCANRQGGYPVRITACWFAEHALYHVMDLTLFQSEKGDQSQMAEYSKTNHLTHLD